MQDLLDRLVRVLSEVCDEAAPSWVLGMAELVKRLRSRRKFDPPIEGIPNNVACHARGEGFTRRKKSVNKSSMGNLNLLGNLQSWY